MATVNLYLDARSSAVGAAAPVKIKITQNRKTVYYPTGVKVLPSQWDKTNTRIIRHPQRNQLNALITELKSKIELKIIELFTHGLSHKTDARKLLELATNEQKNEDVAGVFLTRFRAYADSRKTEGTRGLYYDTIKRMEAYDPGVGSHTFEDIGKAWLQGFEQFMARSAKSANSRSIHLRNIRAVFNDAIDDGITEAYPFRRFKIEHQPTRKRALSVDQLRVLASYPVEPWVEKYRDMFVLMFMLCGINAADLFTLRPDSLCGDRLVYVRRKTHKMYSIKVEPEALELINRYRGKEYLLSICDEVNDYKEWLRRMDRALKKIGPMEKVGRGGKKVYYPLFPDLSQYWCRHTWATLAAELDIPKETIAAGLGHGGNSVTDIYIDFNQRKVDAANRMIIDHFLAQSSHEGQKKEGA